MIYNQIIGVLQFREMEDREMMFTDKFKGRLQNLIILSFI